MLSTTPIAYNWSGFYIGAHGGWGFNDGAFDDGFVVGGQLGINWQFNNFVFGIEGDGSFVDYGSVDSLETIRGRVGLAFDRFLVYGTGGGAFQDFDDLGWVGGGGVEYAFTDFVSARRGVSSLRLRRRQLERDPRPHQRPLQQPVRL